MIYFLNSFRQQEELYRRTSEHSEDSTLPASANSSVSEGPMSPSANAMESLFEAEATHSQEVESLKRLLQEVRKGDLWFIFSFFCEGVVSVFVNEVRMGCDT